MNLTDKDITKGSRVESLIEQKANDMVNKLEATPFVITNEKVNKILDDSSFSKLRRKLGKMLSKRGKAGLFMLPFKDTYLLDVLEITDYSAIGSWPTEVIGTSGKITIKDNVEFPIYTKLYYKDGKPTLERFINIKDGEIEIVDEGITFNTDFLPVEVFINDEADKSDIEHAKVIKDLIRLDYFDCQQKDEWELTKTMLLMNLNFTDNDPQELLKAITSGDRALVEDSYNAKVGGGTAVQGAGTGTVVLQQQILFLEDDIKIKMGIKRDNATGTNKHNLEMVMSEQYALETLLAKKTMREEHWNSMFNKLFTIVGETPIIVELVISPIEQAKLDLLQATVMEAQIKAQNIESQNSNEETQVEGE